ncbi:MAG: cache domain-containing protein [Desulfobacula sp.]|jgi:PAS domain S-box-containing protein
MTDKTKSISAVMLIILTLSGVHLFQGVRLYKKTMNENITEAIHKTSFIVNTLVQNSHIIYDSRMDILIRDEKILLPFYNRNRDELYRAALPYHEAYKSENGFYSNMHFHLPSGHSFLRMHKPEEFEDDLTQIRPMIMQVHKDKKSISGYETGKHGLFYRVAKPVFFNGGYIGVLEIGIQAEQAGEMIKADMDIKVARCINDENLNDDFQEFGKKEIHIRGVSLNPYKERAFFDQIAKSYDFSRKSVQQIMINGLHMAVFTSGNLKDHQDKTIAYFLIAQDISDKITGYRSFLKRSILLTLVLLIGAYLILHFSFGSYINKIIELNKTLEGKVKKRTQDLERITDRLLVTNAELDRIFNTAADGMRVIDTRFNVLRANDAFVKLTGHTKEKLLSSLCHEHFKGRLCFSPECTLMRILNGEEFIEIDVEKEMDSGEKRSFLLTATPFKSGSGEILGVVENFKDITRRKNNYRILKEHEQYLDAVMSTVQAGVIITDEKSPLIIDANPFALKLIGCSKEDLLSSDIRKYFSLEKSWIDTVLKTGKSFEKDHYILTTALGEKLSIRLSIAAITLKGRTYLVQSFSDMTDIRRFIENQVVDIHKAKSILNLVNPPPPRYMVLPSERRLFTEVISIPCHAEGGDHLLLKHFSDHDPPKTIISLKDQSGHEVNCILRSIYTDLFHNAILFNHPEISLEQAMAKLNEQLCQSGFFKEDDFFTSITAQIDHRSLMMSHISAGHPPFILIRNNKAGLMPHTGDEKNHLPVPFIKNAAYVSTGFQLKENDQLLFYTDGLTEMPIRNSGAALSNDELVHHVQIIIDDFLSATGDSMPVSLLTTALLERISAVSRETVLPGQGGGSDSVNTSSDDVTVAGIEIESIHEAIAINFSPETAAGVSGFTQSIIAMIFEQKRNKDYHHMKNRIAMILEEALLNAWAHGNRKNPEKPVTLRFYSRNDFVFEIIDQGRGFDYLHLPDPTLAENIEKDSGRGLFIIRHFSDHVEWKGCGNHIIISLKKLKALDNRADMENRSAGINIWGKNS